MTIQIKLVDAMRVMKSTGRITHYAKLHRDIFSQVHVPDLFLTYHRAFILEFENELRAIGGDDITLPFIDFSGDADSYEGQVEKSVANHPYYYGQMDEANQCLTGQLYDTWILNSVFESGECIARAKEINQEQLINGWAEIDNQIISNENFAEFSEQTNSGLHLKIHLRYGGHMAELFSPVDPLFFGLHAFVDMTFSTWQYVHDKFDSIHMDNEPVAWSSFEINNNTYYHGQVFHMDNQCVQYQRYWPSKTSEEVVLTKRHEDSTSTTSKTSTATETATSTSTETAVELEPLQESTEYVEPLLKAPETIKINKEELEAYQVKLQDHYIGLKSSITNATDCRQQIGGFYKDSFITPEVPVDPKSLAIFGIDPIKYKQVSEKRQENKLELEKYGNIAMKTIDQVVGDTNESTTITTLPESITNEESMFTGSSTQFTMVYASVWLINTI